MKITLLLMLLTISATAFATNCSMHFSDLAHLKNDHYLSDNDSRQINLYERLKQEITKQDYNIEEDPKNARFDISALIIKGFSNYERYLGHQGLLTIFDKKTGKYKIIRSSTARERRLYNFFLEGNRDVIIERLADQITKCKSNQEWLKTFKSVKTPNIDYINLAYENVIKSQDNTFQITNTYDKDSKEIASGINLGYVDGVIVNTNKKDTTNLVIDFTTAKAVINGKKVSVDYNAKKATKSDLFRSFSVYNNPLIIDEEYKISINSNPKDVCKFYGFENVVYGSEQTAEKHKPVGISSSGTSILEVTILTDKTIFIDKFQKLTAIETSGHYYSRIKCYNL